MAEQPIFRQAAAEGRTLFVSTGDIGGSCTAVTETGSSTPERPRSSGRPRARTWSPSGGRSSTPTGRRRRGAPWRRHGSTPAAGPAPSCPRLSGRRRSRSSSAAASSRPGLSPRARCAGACPTLPRSPATSPPTATRSCPGARQHRRRHQPVLAALGRDVGPHPGRGSAAQRKVVCLGFRTATALRPGPEVRLRPAGLFDDAGLERPVHGAPQRARSTRRAGTGCQRARGR